MVVNDATRPAVAHALLEPVADLLEGRPYRSGESVPGQPLKVGAIGFTSVELKGPKGKTILSTNPLHPSGPRPVVEAQ